MFPSWSLPTDKLIRDATNGGGSQLRVLCLDKRTGQTVYRNDSAARYFDAPASASAAKPIARPSVALEMSAGKIQLTMTDRPRPPQPPANDDLEAPREIVERGLRGLGQRMGGAWRGALEKPAAEPARQQPQPQNGQNRPNQHGVSRRRRTKLQKKLHRTRMMIEYRG